MNILLTGSQGYVGSILCQKLMDLNNSGFAIYGIDNLSNVRELKHSDKIKFSQIDLFDREKLDAYFNQFKFDIVIHLAAKIYVHDSFVEKDHYIKNNIEGTQNLIENCRKHQIRQFIFASSSTLYQSPTNFDSISENSNTQVLNPYGQTKFECENFLKNTADMSGYIFRFFNIAGADPIHHLGQNSIQPKHVIDRICHLISTGHRTVDITGFNLSTPDGTIVRDFIHVLDVVDLLILAIFKIRNEPGFETFNCGSGQGTSLLKLISVFEKTTGHQLQINYKNLHSGDPVFLLSNSDKAQKYFNWRPKFSDIENIVGSAYAWSQIRKKYQVTDGF